MRMAKMALTYKAGCDDVVISDNDNIIQSAPTGYIQPRHIDGGRRGQLGVPPLSAEPGSSVDSLQRGEYQRRRRQEGGDVYWMCLCR